MNKMIGRVLAALAAGIGFVDQLAAPRIAHAGGSMAWFNYTSDDGTVYAVFMDKSNAVAAGFVANTTAIPKLPRGVEMRHLNLQSATSVRKKKLPVPTVANLLWTGATLSVTLATQDGDESFVTQSFIGERRTHLRNIVDTGLTDADPEE